MEQGMMGMCVGEQVELIIPPSLAFDDPTKQFSSQPVPKGSFVTYKVGTEFGIRRKMKEESV